MQGPQLAERFDRLGIFVYDPLKMLPGFLQTPPLPQGCGQVNPVLTIGPGQINCLLEMSARFVRLPQSQEAHPDLVVGNSRVGPDGQRSFQGIDRLLMRTVPGTGRT